jgi:hypothetical protein
MMKILKQVQDDGKGRNDVDPGTSYPWRIHLLISFFNRASRYSHASQGFLPFFFGYERISSFIGVRELVALPLGSFGRNPTP